MPFMSQSDQPISPDRTNKSQLKPLQIMQDEELSTCNRSSQPTPSGTPSFPLAPTLSQRPIRPVIHVSPTKVVRTMSHPVPPTPEKHSPVVLQASGMSPITERNSMASRLSVRRRASTSAGHPPRSSRHFGNESLEQAEEEAQRWAEEIRRKRESKRRRKEEEEEDRVIVGNKVDANHPSFVTAYNMLTGLRVAVSRVSAKLDRPLTDEDFTFCQKFTFDYKGNELSPASKHDFRFKDYAPWVFRHLRALFHLDPADYLISLTSRILLSELGSPGKSGSFFYFSRDYRFVIKTLHHSEHKYLRKIVRQYYEHVKANPNTLISQFYGLHRVKSKGHRAYLVVINNVFPASKDIHQTFDLKGSTVGREFDEEKLKENPRKPLKDLNWIRRRMYLEFGPRKKELLMTQLTKDINFLASLSVMDYSLLLGIHYTSRGNGENIRLQTLSINKPSNGLQRSASKRLSTREALYNVERRRLSQSGGADTLFPNDEFLERKFGLFTSEEGGFYATNEQDQPTGDIIYYFGVIDFLTTYGCKKHLETWWKSFSHPRDQLSAVPPREYADRFIKFIRANIRTREQVEREKREDNETGVSPLQTVEEQEDRQFLERVQREVTKRDSSHGEKKEEKDIGRTTVLTPDREYPQQIVPNVTVSGSPQKSSDQTAMTIPMGGLPPLTERPLVESPTEEKSLDAEPRELEVRQDESVVRRESTV